MEADPYDGYVELSRELLNRSLSEAPQAKDPETMENIAEDHVAQIEGLLFELAGKTWTIRAKIEKEVGKNEETAFRSLDSMIGFMFPVANVLEADERGESVKPPDVIRYVVSGLSVRATSVAHEICALLRAGFPVGAHARWRTLYEVDVIVHVLLSGNRGTAARFVNHRWIQIARDNDRAGAKVRMPGPSVDAMKNRYIRRYGPSFGGTYGWASEVTRRRLGVAKPNLSHLEKIANLDGHGGRVYRAHHGVHADSLGILQLVNEDGIFHSGARMLGIADGCRQTVRVLGEINDALIGLWDRHASSPTTVMLQYLNDELSLVLQEDIFRSMSTPRQ